MAYNPDFNGGNASVERYEDGVKRAIKINASKGAFKRWVAEDDHQELYDWLTQAGEYAYTENENGYFCDPHPLCEGIFAGDFGSFLLKLRDDIEEWGKLSEKQTDVVRKALARAKKRLAEKSEREAKWKEEAAKAPPVPETDERIDVIATILNIKTVEGDFGFQKKAIYKTDAGYKLYGSLPSKIYDAKIGDRVQFSAKVSRSNDTPSFGFINRPTKAKFLS